jgi:Asp-tRNA(Asn)/Glu-tRNA(Gln) amidotransferase A subunit family amidase
MGSPIYQGWRPRADASVVMMLKRAGATIVGKITTTAFAGGDPTATLNPRNLDHTPGGSSAGSAAAVAAGMIPLAVGTQTAGSLIRPASFCGVAAIKPSYRLLPTVGVKCYSWTLDTVGLFAAGVEDLALALAAVTGRPELAEHRLTKPINIGVVAQDFAGPAEAASDAALRIAAIAAERAAASIRILKLPDIFAEAWQGQSTILDFEAHRALAWEYETHHEAVAPWLRAWMDKTAGIAPFAYSMALDIANRARAAFSGALSDLDVVLTYSALGAAPRGLGSTGDARFNRLWRLLATCRPTSQMTDCLSACRLSRRSARTPKLSPPRTSSKVRCGDEAPHTRTALSISSPVAEFLGQCPKLVVGRRFVRSNARL